MTPEQVLAGPPRVLTQEQRESYFDRGYVAVESLIPQDMIGKLNEITVGFVERSRDGEPIGRRFRCRRRSQP